MKNLGETGALAYPVTAQIFGVPHIVSGMRKATNFKFCTHIYPIGTKAVKHSAKVAVGILSEFRKFSGHPYIGRMARSSLP